MPLLPAIDSTRPGVVSDNLVVGNWPLPRASGIANISYKVGHLAEAKCKMVIQNECVCVSCLSSCMRPKCVMTATGFLHMTMFQFPSDNRLQSYAVPCRHSMASRSPAPQRPRGRRKIHCHGGSSSLLTICRRPLPAPPPSATSVTIWPTVVARESLHEYMGIYLGV